MAETADEHLGSKQPSPNDPFPAMRSSTVNPSPLFKYYIHDRTANCRLQLIGALTEAEIPELDGCWRTAKTTLGKRQFILDLRGLASFDDAGRRWLSSMSAEGAA